jgi:hypothetical protein
MVRYSPMNGDVNGDYKNDPIFSRIRGFDPAGNPIEDMMSGNQIFVNAWLARNDSKNQPAIVNARTCFRLRNISE